MNRIVIVFFVAFYFISGDSALGKIIYVKSTATGGNNGSSWTNAYNSLQTALTNSVAPDEIWVAAGTYNPASSDRNIYFSMKPGVGMYGGFLGTETTRSQRKPALNETILSGEIGLKNVREDNSKTLVFGADHAILDGFTIRDAYNSTNTNSGAIINISKDSLVISNCAITANTGNAAGGIYNSNTTCIMTDCTISNNTNLNNVGGGIRITGGSTKLIRSQVFGNSALGGAGLYLYGGSIEIADCAFIGNIGQSSNVGGGVSLHTSYSIISGCVFNGNYAGWGGGLAVRADGITTVTNCTFTGNNVVGGGGVSLTNTTGYNNFYNCTFWGNNGKSYPEIDGGYQHTTHSPCFYNCDIRLSRPNGQWDTTLGLDCGGNIASDPLFLDSEFPVGPDGIWRTWDDNLRLRPGSPCINAGLVKVAPTSDILGNPRIGKPDTGAYEYGPLFKSAAWAWDHYK